MSCIRQALPADAEAVGKIYVETWRAAYPGMLPDRVLLDMSPARQEFGWRRSIAHQQGPAAVFIATSDTGGVVGFASIGPARDGGRRFWGEVHTLYVLPDFQERGYGRELLRACFAHLQRHRMRGVAIWVLGANPARFFYEAMGGCRIGARDESLWGAQLPEVAYGWPDLAHALRPDGPLAEKVIG